MSDVSDILDEFDLGTPVAESVWKRRERIRSQTWRKTLPRWKKELYDDWRVGNKSRSASKQKTGDDHG